MHIFSHTHYWYVVDMGDTENIIVWCESHENAIKEVRITTLCQGAR